MIDVEDVSFSYNHELILENISFKIDQGSYIAIFGPNGGGKTTLLKLLMGFIKPQKGSIKLSCDSSEMGYVPQVNRFDKQFPICALEVVLLGCISQGRKWGAWPVELKTKARAALEQVGLLREEETPFGALSGGQAQRVLMARALVSQPKILLLDEPTANVDAEAEKVIFSLLKSLKNITILVVTHDLQTAASQAEKLLLVKRGVKMYKPSEVCEHFALGLYHP